MKYIIGQCLLCGTTIAAARYDKKTCNRDANEFLDSGLQVSIRELDTVILRECKCCKNARTAATGGEVKP